MNDPVQVALRYVRGEKTRDTYNKIYRRFFASAGITSQGFLAQALKHPKDAESLIVNWAQVMQERKLSPGYVYLNLAAIKTLLDYNDATGLNWKKLKRLAPAHSTFGGDRAPTVEEIRKLLAFCAVRERALVLCMTSGGFRVGALEYFTLADFEPIAEGAKVVAGRLRIYRKEPEEYLTFISPEAVQAMNEYLDFRKRSGESLGPTSYLFRDSWNIREGKVHNPKRMNPNTASAMFDRLLAKAGMKEREFKELHGFRKFFKTRAEQAMKSVYVEILMGHSLGLANSYLKPTERELLQEYLKAIPYLAVQEAAELKRELSEKDKDIQKLGQILEEIRFRVEYLEQRDRLEGR